VSIDRFLTHRVSLVRRVAVLGEDDQPTVDEYNLPVTAEQATSGIAASIQPRTVREMASLTQAGPALSDYRIYLRPRDIRTSDVIVHDPDACPVRTDLPLARFEIVGVPDAAGAGHHVEVWAKHVGAPSSAYDVPVGAGS
jgi:hypothetical protein